MKTGSLTQGLLVVLSICCFVSHPLHGAVIVHVDMDVDLVGIQASRVGTPGQPIKVALVAEIDGAGVSSYGFSVMYDNLELSLVAADDTPPAALTNLVTGTIDTDLGGGISQVASFDGFTFTSGPADLSVIIGTMDFSVISPLDDGTFDITPGFFVPSDGAFDNSLPLGLDLGPTTVFNPGSVVVIP